MGFPSGHTPPMPPCEQDIGLGKTPNFADPKVGAGRPRRARTPKELLRSLFVAEAPASLVTTSLTSPPHSSRPPAWSVSQVSSFNWCPPLFNVRGRNHGLHVASGTTPATRRGTGLIFWGETCPLENQKFSETAFSEMPPVKGHPGFGRRWRQQLERPLK